MFSKRGNDGSSVIGNSPVLIGRAFHQKLFPVRLSARVATSRKNDDSPSNRKELGILSSYCTNNATISLTHFKLPISTRPDTQMSLYSFAPILLLLLPFCLTQSLPAYSGTYGVGLIDIEVPVQNPRNITNTTWISNGNPAFFLQTVLFSLYYPIAPGTNSSSPQHPWIGDPVGCVSAGIVAYANSSSVTTDLVSAGLNSVAGSVYIPAQADAPLVHGSSPFPVLLFSVGDITLRTWYSQYAGQLATSGYFVAVIEHRDGSLACSVVEQKGRTSQMVQYIEPDQLR